jgi:cell division protein FtsL
MKKPIFVLLTLILIITILIAVRSAVSTRIITSGLELGDVKDKTSYYKTENTLLREKIFSLSSLTRISEAAYKAGFVESKSNFAVSAAQPIARKQ